MLDDPAVRLLSELVRRRSITPDDAGCQRLLAARLEAAGFHSEHLRFGDVDNLWARHGRGDPVLVFAGHTDVVPAGDEKAWTSDAFVPSLRHGRMYGRGTADMKSGLAAMVVAAEHFVARHPDHPGSLAFLLTSDEEGPARDGTRRVIEDLAKRGERIEWCVLGEPSSAVALGDTIRIGRRGSLSCRVLVTGVQGHVAYPQLADNPIRRFAPVLAELHDIVWDEGNAHFPPTSFQVVEISSSSGAVNVTPGELRARINFRYSTEWDHAAIRDRVEQIFAAHELDYVLDWHLSGEPFLTGPGPLIEAVVDAVRAETGQAPELSTGGGTSDGRFISPAGAEVVELGPVSASIHKVDEYVELEDVPRLAAIYLDIAERLLA
ncbi:MAG: succinyl-diaminopimelate desuccinylase [Gammaproteobacteria bacterium]|nr:succinyl-diaminopimelate desuccinylase [Gammaproteobacteria bacterium]